MDGTDGSESLSPATRPCRSERVVSREIGGETVLVPIRGNVGDLDHVYTLSEVASFIWGSLDGNADVESLTHRLVEEFEVDEATARADLQEFLTDLHSVGLIEAKEGSG